MAHFCVRNHYGDIFEAPLDVEEDVVHVHYPQDPEGTTRKFWKMPKRNVDYNEAPTVALWNQEINNFVKYDKCSCCYFDEVQMERFWLQQKLQAGIALAECVGEELNDPTVHPLASFGQPLHPQPVAQYKEYRGKYDPPYEIRIYGGREIVHRMDDDPASWLYEYKGEVYWRSESSYETGFPIYYRPDTAARLLRRVLTARPDIQGMTYGMDPETFASNTLLLNKMERIAQMLGSNHPLTQKWLDADLHPTAKK